MNKITSQSHRAWTGWSKSLTLALVLWATLPAGAGQEQLAASIGDTRNEVVATRDRLQSTVDALDALVKQKEGSLKPAYEVFVAEVKKTQADAAATKARAEKMQTDSQTHFGAWQKEIDSLNNEKLRRKAQKRLETVRKSYDRTIAKLRDAAMSFAPYLSDLDDITKILSNDLTPGGVKAIRSTVSKAKYDLEILRRHINDAVKELDVAQKSLSTSAK